MSFAKLPAAGRLSIVRLPSRQRQLHTSSQARASVLFALGALSNSRETFHFNKISRLPRTEHSPPLKLIKTSEVDTYPLPDPPKQLPRSSAWTSARGSSALKIWDDKALKIGRVFLSNEARRSQRMKHALARVKHRQAAQDILTKKERLSWQQERFKLEQDVRAAGLWILISIGTATALATWRFFPGFAAPRDSSELSRKLAARAAAAMPLPVAVASNSATTTPAAPAAPVQPVKKIVPPTTTSEGSTSNWWKGLFWRQQ